MRSVISTNFTLTPKRVNECYKRAKVQPYILLLAIITSSLFKNVQKTEAMAPIPLLVTAQA